jgi:cation diffusion facilitator CzcD-associated flavoprotein CzcO
MQTTIAIIGAGPYGLASIAHLRQLPGLSIHIFGEPMSFWQEYMPKGMLLRSGWKASYIADPAGQFTLEAFESASGARVARPVPLEQFVEYGKWFQRQVAPEADHRKVTALARDGRGFHLTINGKETLAADLVIVAAGISPFAWRPPDLDGLPRELASHTSEYSDLSHFRGQRVAIVGGGQSALESAALLQEAGASPEVFARATSLHWLGWRERLGRVGILSRMFYSWTDVGPPGFSKLVAKPNYFRMLPRGLQDPIARRCIRPAGAGWLRHRLTATPMHTGLKIRSVSQNGSGLKLQLSNGKQTTADHLLFGTGYRVDIENYGFLDRELLGNLARVNGYPVLGAGFESSIPGLYFVGAPAAWSYGPLMRFVSGTQFTARAVAAHIASNLPTS